MQGVGGSSPPGPTKQQNSLLGTFFIRAINGTLSSLQHQPEKSAEAGQRRSQQNAGFGHK